MILVTGASGLVGYEICSELQRLALTYAYVGRDQIVGLSGKYIRWDLSKEPFESVNGQFPKPSVIIHCAAVTPSSAAELAESAAQTNRIIDDNIGACAASSSAKVIFTSTTAVYGSGGDRKMCESDPLPCGLLSPYALEKSASERMFLDLHPCNIILRINAPYGARQRQLTVLKRFILSALDGQDIEVFSGGVRKQDFTHVSDIARLAACVTRSSRGGVFNISAGNPISMLDLARLVLSVAGAKSARVVLSEVKDPQVDFRANFDTRKARAELGWVPKVTLRQGLTAWLERIRR